MCIGYRSRSHRQAEEGWHLNPAECHRYCIESSQCANGYLLGVEFALEFCKVSIMQSGQVSQILTELKCFAFLKYLQENLVNRVTARKSLPELGYILLHIPYTDTKRRHHIPQETQAQGIPWLLLSLLAPHAQASDYNCPLTTVMCSVIPLALLLDVGNDS